MPELHPENYGVSREKDDLGSSGEDEYMKICQREAEVRDSLDGQERPIILGTEDTQKLGLKVGDLVTVHARLQPQERKSQGNSVKITTPEGREGWVGLYTVFEHPDADSHIRYMGITDPDVVRRYRARYEKKS